MRSVCIVEMSGYKGKEEKEDVQEKRGWKV